MLGQGVRSDSNPSDAAIDGPRSQPNGPTDSHCVAKKIWNTSLPLSLFSGFPTAPAPIPPRRLHRNRTIARRHRTRTTGVLHHGSLHRTPLTAILPLHRASTPLRPSTARPALTGAGAGACAAVARAQPAPLASLSCGRSLPRASGWSCSRAIGSHPEEGIDRP
jgi:hypothetical protein